jgi:hypothetical protein
MKSSTSTAFRKQFAALNPELKRLARKQFRLWLAIPRCILNGWGRIGPPGWIGITGRWEWRTMEPLYGSLLAGTTHTSVGFNALVVEAVIR